MSSKQSQDPRAIRSRRWLQESLLALIEEKPYQTITVTDITERAEISRPTFYLHYGSKDELLLSCLDNMFDQFYEEIDGYLDGIAIEESYVNDPIYAREAGHLNVGSNKGDLAVPCFSHMDTEGKQWRGCNYTLDVPRGWYDAGDHGKYVVKVITNNNFMFNFIEHFQT